MREQYTGIVVQAHRPLDFEQLVLTPPLLLLVIELSWLVHITPVPVSSTDQLL